MDQFRLENIPFPLLMKDLLESRFSGIVFLNNETIRKGLIFNDGRLCAIQSNKPDELLGHILVQMGKISEEDNAMSLEKARTDRVKQGYVLMEKGLIQAPDVSEALTLQFEKRFLDIFGWKGGAVQKVAKQIDKTAALGAEELAALVRRGIMEKLPFATVVNALSPHAETRPRPLREDLPKDIAIDIDRVVVSSVAELLLLGPEVSRSLLALYCSGLIVFEQSKHKALIEQLKQTYRELQDKDPYGVLDVDSSISEGGLKRAYIKMVKVHHPDAYSYADDPEVKRLANEIFNLIHRAYSEIQRLREGKQPEKSGLDEELQAEILFAQGTQALKARDYQKSLDLFRLCVNMKPQERVFAESYVKTMFLKWQNTGLGTAAEIKASIFDATRKFPKSDTLYVTLGWVLKQEGANNKAIEAFKRALQLNPKNMDAQRELRLYQMRGQG
ncbi:MAG TPA: tetratricopeptide repeat protein [Deltaproteobacteria bacterium]|nr:tetratricopeptide repeat protein [Deltaproteobacteria bacterium]